MGRPPPPTMGKPQTQELRLNPYEVFCRPQQTLQIIPSFPFTVGGGGGGRREQIRRDGLQRVNETLGVCME